MQNLENYYPDLICHDNHTSITTATEVIIIIIIIIIITQNIHRLYAKS
jgi:hypothetical protein